MAAMMFEEDKSIDKFVTRLRDVAANRCDFHRIDLEIKDQIVQKCLYDRLRRKKLREDLSLANLVNTARAMEIADAQKKALENPSILNSNSKIVKNENTLKTKECKERIKTTRPKTRNTLTMVDRGHIEMVESLARRGDLNVGIVERRIIMQGSAKQLKG
ncbi:Transposon Tf2-9 poly [Paramuricea clavata]|uniref:Transposon Tf2-9 poly n=1 Tax=Paramuricea clavata TaxID=317549 RepID=A0A6S7LBI0_PARCT|nr:Transposon Tf2-9 poly [Paramuricea clavata]